MHKTTDVNTILLIDDSEDDIDLTLMAFEEAECTNPIEVRHNGIEALEYLTSVGEDLPGLILLDWKMPRMNGRDFLKTIKAHPEWRQIPTCVLTTSDAPEDITEAYLNHANAYIKKPVSFNALVQLMQQAGAFWMQWVLTPAHAHK